MADETPGDALRAFSSSDLEAFLKRLGIPVNGSTMSLALKIDTEMRNGARAAAQAAAQRLVELFRAAPAEAGDDTERFDYNENALDPTASDADLVRNALKLYANMQITLQAVDPEESPATQIYSDELLDRIISHAALPNDPLIKPMLKRIGAAYATAGGEAAARSEALGLVSLLIADDHIQAADRNRVLERIMNTLRIAETALDDIGDPDGNEDLYGETEIGDGPAPEDAEIDLSERLEEDRRQEARDRRTRELHDRALVEANRRAEQLFSDFADRDGGLIDALGLADDNADDVALANEIREVMGRITTWPGRVSSEGLYQVTVMRAKIEELAARLAARNSGEAEDRAALATELTRKIAVEASDVAKTIEAQLATIQAEAIKAVEEEMRQEVENSAPDVKTIAEALKEHGQDEARQLAARIVQAAQGGGTQQVSEADRVKDLLVRAQAYLDAMDDYERKDWAEVEEALKADDGPDAAGPARAEAKTGETQAEPSAAAAAPWTSQHREVLEEISFLQASGDTDEARTLAAKLAERLRASGGALAGIDVDTVMDHVARQDAMASEAREAAQSESTEDDSDDEADRASWFLLMALTKDAKSKVFFDGLVRVMVLKDKTRTAQFSEALAAHILKMYKTTVTKKEMLAAIVAEAKRQAKAKEDEISGFSPDDSDSDDGSSSDAGDADDEGDDQPDQVLTMARREDAKSGEIYNALVRTLLKGDKATGSKLAKALAAHILNVYRTNVTMPDLMQEIIRAALESVRALRQRAAQTSSDSGYEGDGDDSGDEDKGGNGAAGGIAPGGRSGARDSQSTYDLSTVRKVDWPSFLGIYGMDAEESEAAADVAKLIVKKGTGSSGALKSAKDLLGRSSKKVKGAKVKNHKHLVAAIEDAMIKRADSKKVVKPLRFSDIFEDDSDDISV
ncbi:hypothetical protein AB1M95_08085 [Sulfitobacter sp. LCG007]